ncbi:MAG: Zn-ribbon domain-containing OB-fold protein [Solirubrobacteraceae bacterium]
MSHDGRRSQKEPIPSKLGEGHWAAAREGRLALQRCNACSRHFHYPSAICEHCLSRDIGWADVSGLGTVESFSVVHRAFSPDFADDVPYVVALVKLDEDVNLLTWVVGTAPEDVRIGMRVEATFERVSDEIWLHRFRSAA